MAGTHHLPVENAMSASSPFSRAPIVLTTGPEVEAFLAATPFHSQSIISLPGGFTNYTYRIYLRTPFEGQETVVLKHAQPYSRGFSRPSEVIRQRFEVEAMTRVRTWLETASAMELPLIAIPRIYHFDEGNNIIIMEDCGVDAVPLDDFLCSGKASLPGVAETLGRCLGGFIGSLHEWSRGNPDGILDVFNECLHAKKMAAYWTSGLIVSTLDRTGEDVLPALLDPPFEVDVTEIQLISRIVKELEMDIMSARDVFVMGDYRPANVVVKLDPSHQLRKLYIIDWEDARTGPQGDELGPFCAGVHFLMRFNDVAREPASAMLSCFLDAYSHTSKPDRRVAQDTLTRWGVHLAIFPPRVAMGDKQTTRAVVREGVDLLVGSRKEEFIAQSVVKVLLPQTI